MTPRRDTARRMRRAVFLACCGALLAAACGSSSTSAPKTAPPWWKGVAVADKRGQASGGQYPEVHVDMLDNSFSPSVLRIDPGVTVVWTNIGRSVHNIIKAMPQQDFGRQFGVDTLAHNKEYEFRFATPGVYRYYCTLHGSANKGMVGLIAVGDVDIDTGQATVASGPTRSGTLRVPQDYRTIQAAVDATKPGSLVLISPGVYHEGVHVDPGHENIVLRGTDRNTVILDGQFDTKKPNGVIVQADGVAVENMTARNYVTNAFYWRGVKGYRGSYLSSYRTGDYGIYAFDAEIGEFDHDYAVGSRDASYYIGQCSHCRATITDSVGEWSGLGYSGTNAGGNLIIANSTFRFNRAGIVPNSETGEKLYPQRGVIIVGNRVYSNNNDKTPAIDDARTVGGNGILTPGGNDNVIEHNLVWDHDIYGIGLIPFPERFLDPSNPKAIDFPTTGNAVHDNTVRQSRTADLAVIRSLDRTNDGGGNCFSNNTFTTSSPARLEQLLPCGAPPSTAFTADLKQFVTLFSATKAPDVDYKVSPLPPLAAQANMPDPLHAPARPANKDLPIHVDVAAIATPTR